MENSAYLFIDGWGFFPVAYSGQVAESPGFTHSEFRSAAGGRSVTYRPVTARSWKVSGKVPADWAQNLLRIQSGAFGRGPFWWLPPAAQRFNALPYGFDGATSPGVDESGVVVPVVHGDLHVSGATPVRDGLQVTASAWLTSGDLTIRFLAQSGAVISNITQSASGVLGRKSITAVAPANAVSARVVVSGAGVDAGQPAITWSGKPHMYAPPMGCASVFVNPGDWSHEVFGFDPADTLVSVGFDVLEVTGAAS